MLYIVTDGIYRYTDKLTGSTLQSAGCLTPNLLLYDRIKFFMFIFMEDLCSTIRDLVSCTYTKQDMCRFHFHVSTYHCRMSNYLLTANAPHAYFSCTTTFDDYCCLLNS